MDTSLLKKQVITDFNALIELKAKAANNQQQTLNVAARQFEAIFVQNLMKSMRQANHFLSEDSPLKSKQTEQFEEMLDQQRALELSSQGKGIGLAEVMINQLDNRNMKLKYQQQKLSGNNLPDSILKQLSENFFNRDAMMFTPKDFVKSILPAAKLFAQQLGVDPKLLVAQAIHETGWGKSINTTEQGGSSYNLFNIKGGSQYNKNQSYITTTEYIEGKPVKVKEPFRDYASFEESFQDYVSLIKHNERYHEALSRSADPEQYMAALQQAGYATDPNYAAKVLAIYNGSTLSQAVDSLESR